MAAVNRALSRHSGESLLIPVAAAGEFLDGAFMVSKARAQEALHLLRGRLVVSSDLGIAERYGSLVTDLRKKNLLKGRSQNDLWISATAVSRGARLLTRNERHFSGIEGLTILAYG
jgi:predicted nucleic acid-binding protein